MKRGRDPAPPSRTSLSEIPEVRFDTARVTPNPYAARIAAEGMVQVRRGRPRKGTETGPTILRSIRLPAAVWRRVEARARSEGLSVHAALRVAVLVWMERGR